MCDLRFDLLKPFDFDAAAEGAIVCDQEGAHITSNYVIGALFVAGKVDLLRMAPLCWLDGKPVYHDSILIGALSGHAYLVAENDAKEVSEAVEEGFLRWPEDKKPSLPFVKFVKLALFDDDVCVWSELVPAGSPYTLVVAGDYNTPRDH